MLDAPARSAQACTSSARYTSPVRSISASAAKASFARLQLALFNKALA
jgi:hypothetical protein